MRSVKSRGSQVGLSDRGQDARLLSFVPRYHLISDKPQIFSRGRYVPIFAWDVLMLEKKNKRKNKGKKKRKPLFLRNANGLGILYFDLLTLAAVFPEMANWLRGWVRAETVDRERALGTGFRGAVGLSTLLKVRGQQTVVRGANATRA